MDLVYQKTGQLREMSLLDNDNPPAIYPLHFVGISADENGLYKAEDVMQRLNDAISSYDELIEEYEQDEAA